LVRTALLAAAVAISACQSQPVDAAQSSGAFAPANTRTLRSFGAAGDGIRDDTASVQAALAGSGAYCIDGERRRYRINGSLRATQDLCLRNATLIQSQPPFDTRPYIRGTCPVTESTQALMDCGDRRLKSHEMAALLRATGVRTLLIRPGDDNARIRVRLERVTVDRGRFPEGGSRTDSAGIWLDGASRADFRDVEITGHGKGYGLFITRARNVTLSNLWIHDLVWSPYPGDAPLVKERVAAVGWNRVPIREFREATARFHGVRVQEQITCAYLADVQHVRIENLRINRCMARFAGGDLPWQADGLTVGRNASDIVVSNATIDSTWEGMDVVAGGAGIDGLVVAGATITNSFGYGLKLGYRLRRPRIENVTVARAGLAGVVVYGPVTDLQLSQTRISEVGSIATSGGKLVPWPTDAVAGIRIDEGESGDGPGLFTPRNTVISSVEVSGGNYDFGILNKGAAQVRVTNFRAAGFRKTARLDTARDR
jgi:hypothetical protein